MTERLIELHDILHNSDGKHPFSVTKGENSPSSNPLSFLETLRRVCHPNSSTEMKRQAEHLPPIDRSHIDWNSKELLPEAIQQIVQQILLASKQTSPIVAIAGVLNAGKSSLVASFLSPSGRERLLIGSSNKQGTHRFVLWLPESWRESPPLWENTLTEIENVFGRPAEELSSDKHAAYQQYNGHYSQDYQDKNPSSRSTQPLLVPLVATDAALDTYGIGLMDCPDIETGFFTDIDGNESVELPASASLSMRTDTLQAMFANQRRLALTSSLQISSAFVVVTPANSIQDQTVNDILAVAGRVMPGLRMMLAVNRVPRRYLPPEIADEIRHGYSESGLWRVYMAYHFDGPLLRERLPNPPRESLLDKESAASLPIFFRIDKHGEKRNATGTLPDSIPTEDFLVSIGNQLDPSRLTQERLEAMKATFKSKVNEGIRLISDHNQQCLARRERWHKTLAQAIFNMSMQDKSKSSETGTLRLQVSRELIQQISNSLEKTAPWWALPGRLAIKWSSRVQEAASNATNWFQIPSWITKKASRISSFVTSRWRTGEGGRIISPHDFFETIVAYDLSHRLISNESLEHRKQWEDRFQQALNRFQTESRIRLSDEQLDEYTAEMWRRMSWSQRLWTGIAPAGIVFAPVLAVLMLPLDFGGTTVLLAATGKELLLAGMTAVGVSMLNTDTMPKLAENETAWNQLSELFAMLCDELGFDRPAPDQMPVLNTKTAERALLVAKIPTATQPTIDPLDGYYPIESSSLKLLRSTVNEI